MSKKYKTLYDKEQEEMKKNNYKKYKGEIHRGDIFYFDKGYTVGVEQQGGRPGIIVSNDACNSTSEFLLVCYLTTQPKTCLPTHVPIMCEQPSICLCEQVHTLSKEKMQKYYCSATPEEMKEIDKALAITLGIDVNNILPKDFLDAINKMTKKEKNLDDKVLELETKLAEQLSANSKLVDEIQHLKKEMAKPIVDAPDYIRVCTERDVYIKLYNDLLNQKAFI